MITKINKFKKLLESNRVLDFDTPNAQTLSEIDNYFKNDGHYKNMWHDKMKYWHNVGDTWEIIEKTEPRQFTDAWKIAKDFMQTTSTNREAIQNSIYEGKNNPLDDNKDTTNVDFSDLEEILNIGKHNTNEEN